MRFLNRNVIVLGAAQALSLSATVMVTLLGGIVGGRLAPAAGLATLPVSALILGTACSTVPAALIMRRLGRRAGFVLGALAGALAAVGAGLAVDRGSFGAFCAATFALGFHVAFALQYRYAAAESVHISQASKAVSAVLLGTLLAAYVGPEVAAHFRNVGSLAPHAGGFLALAAMLAAAAGLLAALQPVAPLGAAASRGARPLGEIVRAPEWLVAVVAGTVAYGVMSFVMTATPVSMHIIDGHTLDDTAWVIQSHVMAMYLPSLASGWLIARIGLVRVMVIGLACLVACMLYAASNQTVLYYWGALVLLGVGWNFLFVASTTLIAQSARAGEGFKTQALTELLIFGTTATASLLSGLALHSLGWRGLIAATVPPLLLMAAAILWLAARRRGVPAS